MELIAIHLHTFNCMLCVVYVPPSITLQPFQNVLSFLATMVASGSVLIMGDFNRPDINWLSLTSSSLLSDIFCDFVFDNSLTQLVQEPTHSKNNCLDLVLSNFPENVGPIDISQDSLIHAVRSLHALF